MTHEKTALSDAIRALRESTGSDTLYVEVDGIQFEVRRVPLKRSRLSEGGHVGGAYVSEFPIGGGYAAGSSLGHLVNPALEVTGSVLVGTHPTAVAA